MGNCVRLKRLERSVDGLFADCTLSQNHRSNAAAINDGRRNADSAGTCVEDVVDVGAELTFDLVRRRRVRPAAAVGARSGKRRIEFGDDAAQQVVVWYPQSDGIAA